MIEKNQLQKLLKSILRHKNDLPDHQIMHPFREWLICLVVTTILLAVMVFFCIRLYQHYTSLTPDQTSSETQKTTNVIYRSEEVETSLENFANRRNTHDTIKQSLENKNTTLLPEISTEAASTSASTTPIVISESNDGPNEIPTMEETPAIDTPLPVTEAEISTKITFQVCSSSLISELLKYFFVIA
jgi:cytoskeletal protein RodZ